MFKRIVCALSMLIASSSAWSGPTPDWSYPVEPGNWVNSVAVSSQAEVVLAGSCNLAASAPGTYQVAALDYTGQAKWKDTLSGVYRGVFWTALSQDGAYGAVGGLYSKSPYHGFVRAYDVATGTLLLNDTSTEQRVNVVALSQNGLWLIAADGGSGSKHSSLRLYKRNTAASPQQFVLADSYDAGTQSIGTAAMSQDGAWVVTGAGGPGNVGVVKLFQVINGKLVLVKTWTAPAGSIYIQAVDMSAQGDWFAAAIPNHSVAVFKTQSFLASGSYAYLASINHGCGGHNVYGMRMAHDGSGIIAASNCGTDAAGGWIDAYSAPKSGSSAALDWSLKTLRPPNAGVGIDHASHYVGAGDGHPLGSASNFYLIHNGHEAWRYATTNMNWGAAISEAGDAMAGGSDDGHVYFWKIDKLILQPIDPDKFKTKPRIPRWEWPMAQDKLKQLNTRVLPGERFSR